MHENVTQEEDMARHISVRPVDAVPADVRICHYDELDESAKERFPELVRQGGGSIETDVDGRTATELEKCELVKYTDYFRVRSD